jgi:hypothetical protein
MAVGANLPPETLSVMGWNNASNSKYLVQHFFGPCNFKEFEISMRNEP